MRTSVIRYITLFCTILIIIISSCHTHSKKESGQSSLVPSDHPALRKSELNRNNIKSESGRLSVVALEDYLIEGYKTFPVFLEKGETVFYNIRTDKSTRIQIYNADNQELLKEYNEDVTDSLSIKHTAIYLVHIFSPSATYMDMSVELSTPKPQHRQIVNVRERVVPSEKDGFLVKESEGIEMINISEEPIKITLHGQLKNAISTTTGARSVISLPIPEGCTDILYSFRISTSESIIESDGKFYKNSHELYYRKIKILGLNLYESEKSPGILKMLLDDNHPITDNDCYCNFYVFDTPDEAKKFQDTQIPVSQLEYDIDCSRTGAQSSDGKIPCKGQNSIYIGFENTRVRFSNYICFEAIAVKPIIEYTTTQYSL